MTSKEQEKKVRRARILIILALNDDMEENLGLEIGDDYTKALSTKEIQDLFDKMKHLDRFTLRREIKISSIRGDLKSLSKEGFIHEEKKVLPGATTYTNFYSLKKDNETLFKILKTFNEADQDNQGLLRAWGHGSDLINSSYGIGLINMDLIKWFENKLKVEFSDIEIDSILKAFKTSPNSLWLALDYTIGIEEMREDYKEFEFLENGDAIFEQEGKTFILKKQFFDNLKKQFFDPAYDKEQIKKSFIHSIQLGIGKEFQYIPKTIMKPDFIVNYEVKITFTPTKDFEKEKPVFESYINDKGDIIHLQNSASVKLNRKELNNWYLRIAPND